MKHMIFMFLLASLLLASVVSGQSLAGNSRSGSAGQANSTVSIVIAPMGSSAKHEYSGSYILQTGAGYSQKLTVRSEDNSFFNVEISYSGAKGGCTFKGKGVYSNGRIEVDLSRVNPKLKATMTITVNKDTAVAFTTLFDDRLKLMWFCGGGASLAGHYKRERAQAQSMSWYKMFPGKIDRYPITMHLHRSGYNYNGYYYYDQQHRPIFFSGEDSSTGGKLKLVGFGEPESGEEFVLNMAAEQLTGTWRKNLAAKPLSFTARASRPIIDFKYVFTSGSLPLRPKLRMEDAPVATYFAAAVWPMGEAPQDRYLRKVIRKAFGINNDGNEQIGSLFLDRKKSFFGAYLKDNQSVKDSDIKELPTSFKMDDSKNIMVAHATPNFITLALNSYSYSGGVHGNYGTTYTCIDLVNNKELLLADVINQQGVKALRGLLEKSFRQRYHLKPGESLVDGGLLEDTIKPSQNFYITPTGVTFNYLPYEIGPYALGEISLFIPRVEIEKYLQPAVTSLLQ